MSSLLLKTSKIARPRPHRHSKIVIHPPKRQFSRPKVRHRTHQDAPGAVFSTNRSWTSHPPLKHRSRTLCGNAKTPRPAREEKRSFRGFLSFPWRLFWIYSGSDFRILASPSGWINSWRAQRAPCGVCRVGLGIASAIEPAGGESPLRGGAEVSPRQVIHCHLSTGLEMLNTLD